MSARWHHGAGPGRGLLLAALTMLAGLCSACSDRGERTESSPPTATYRVRGVVRQVSAPSASPARLWIHHEAIPDFVGFDGKVETMQVMTMPFAVAETVELSGIEVGARIAFDLRVDWSAPQPGLVTAIELLPPDAELSLQPGD